MRPQDWTGVAHDARTVQVVAVKLGPLVTILVGCPCTGDPEDDCITSHDTTES